MDIYSFVLFEPNREPVVRFSEPNREPFVRFSGSIGLAGQFFVKMRVEKLAPNLFRFVFLHLGPYLAIPRPQAWSKFCLGM